MKIIKVPGTNGLGHTDGCKDAGSAILQKLKEDIFTSESGKEIVFENLDIDELELDNNNLEEMNEKIYSRAMESFNIKTVFLGGDHSISYSLVRAFLDSCKVREKEPCLIVFDAHPDCMNLWEENKTPDHEEWLSALIAQGFPAENIILVGNRKSHKNEIDFLRDNKIKRIGINSIIEDIDNIADTLMEFAAGKELYVSIDIDVVDPVFAPSTHYQEPGGLTSRDFIYLIQRLNKSPSLKAADIVEIDSVKDLKDNNLTTKLGAKILSELV